MTQVWSCGGGTQSAAIAVLIAQGKLPKPDFGVIVDTEREKSATWEYLEKYIRPACDFPLFRVPMSTYATVDLYSVNGENLLIPAFSNQSGEVGKMDNFCSYEWKRRVIQRFIKKAKGVTQCQIWLGMSLDEMRRVRTGDGWMQHRYPLIFDVPMSRGDCINLVMDFGWPEPPRSSCWMCPNMADKEWRQMKELYPADFQMAVELEVELRLKDPNVFLHQSYKPLDEVDFEDYQGGLFDKGCSSGYCFA